MNNFFTLQVCMYVGLSFFTYCSLYREVSRSTRRRDSCVDNLPMTVCWPTRVTLLFILFSDTERKLCLYVVEKEEREYRYQNIFILKNKFVMHVQLNKIMELYIEVCAYNRKKAKEILISSQVWYFQMFIQSNLTLKQLLQETLRFYIQCIKKQHLLNRTIRRKACCLRQMNCLES